MKEIENKEVVIRTVKELGKIKSLIEGKEIIREVYVPGKMINLVIR